jgi:Rrf2 family protein
MFGLSRKTDYALIALWVIAKHGSDVVCAREIAKDGHLPLPILTNILKALARAGIIVSERGACGGYSLAAPPDAITLFDLITAMEGPLQFVRCALARGKSSGSACGLEGSCPTRLPAHKVHARLTEFLDSITLAELMNDAEEPDKAPRPDTKRLETLGTTSMREYAT